MRLAAASVCFAKMRRRQPDSWLFDRAHTCTCGKRFDIYKIKMPMRDKDSEHCTCGAEIISWNGGVMYRAEPKKNDSATK